MARWTVTPGTDNNSMKGQIDYHEDGSHEYKIYQDEQAFMDQAKTDRENAAHQKKDLGYKKFATIPDIVAIDIKEKWGIDIHEPTFMHDDHKKARFMQIIKENYAGLMAY